MKESAGTFNMTGGVLEWDGAICSILPWVKIEIDQDKPRSTYTTYCAPAEQNQVADFPRESAARSVLTKPRAMVVRVQATHICGGYRSAALTDNPAAMVSSASDVKASA